MKIAYTAAIGDTSANAKANAERKLNPRLNLVGASAWGSVVSVGSVIGAPRDGLQRPCTSNGQNRTGSSSEEMTAGWTIV
ncbi:hypothetical protein MMAD_13450 [Mycolicibacterium madagascariense]|uniref:Uncharacterized protein n=1 Tax=Mycolicibacterium madagascariense TaxID=212765 RepID=A0A7I7XCQ6_9MYCO|nr:hypothetical protein MMAD_13450 [Mycolicibacterium madagascariense]